MKIKTRLTLNFLISVTGILIFFSATVFFFYLQQKNEFFLIRLKNRAINTATLLFKVKKIDSELLKMIDNNSIVSISDVCVIILDKEKKVVYGNDGNDEISRKLPLFRKLNWDKENYMFDNNKLYLCIKWYHNNEFYYILASGRDRYGHAELKKLLFILITVFIFSIIVIVVIGYTNAFQALKPIKEIIRQVDTVKANTLNNRLPVKDQQDEMDELAITFNKMLGRLEQAFETERMFVSNVSHELRTPVTSITGQLEVALLKQRTEQEYKALLHSVLEDIKNTKTIINGFLELAETGIEESSHNFTVLRLDELLFLAKEEILKRKPNYVIMIGFEIFPDDEKEVSISGNERLIKILITNLVDNACKFSEHHRVMIKIGYDNFFVTLRFIDNGIGIPDEELSKIFLPLYRAKNATGKGGHGIGLSIVKRIADLHHATLEIKSELNAGTAVTIMFPNTKAI
jgi:signal transduction histidine kinase